MADRGEIVGYRVVPFRAGVRPTKRSRLVEPGAIAKTWRNRPQEATIQKAREALKPTPDWRLGGNT